MIDEIAIGMIMQAYQGEAPGASVIVIRDGKAILRKAQGLANHYLQY